MTCDAFAQELARAIVDDEPLREALRHHLDSCDACRRIMDWHEGLEGFSLEDDQVSDAEFDRMRTAVLRRIPRHRSPFQTAWRHPFLWLSAAACLCLGVILGSMIAPRSATDMDQVIEGLRRQWDQTGHQGDVAVKNVTLEPLGNGRVAVGFDVSTWVASETSVDDPLVKELLVSSLRQPGSLYHRLQALEVTGDRIDDDVQAALIYAMKHDEALVVRSRAMELLAPHADEAQVSAALIGILRHEPHVQLRLQAIDALMAKDSASDRLQSVLAELQRAGDTPVLMRVKNGAANDESAASHSEM